MKCQNCGAEIGNEKYCSYCGSQITAEMQKEQERLNKIGCPKCGSSNITFRREKQGTITDKNSKQIVNRTVGVCNDCGATWYTDDAPKKKKTWLWVLGWIFIFPLPLTIILVRKKDMNKILKYAIIAIAWIVYLAIGLSGGGDNSDTANAPSDVTTETTIVSTTAAPETTETTTETTTESSTETGSNKKNTADTEISTQYDSSTEQGKIENSIHDRITSKYSNTQIDRITINENLGTDKKGDYIALVYLTWNTKNSGMTSKEMLNMFSSDLAATVAKDNSNVQELAVFWTVPYLNNANAKCSYERKDGKMVEMDMVWDNSFS